MAKLLGFTSPLPRGRLPGSMFDMDAFNTIGTLAAESLDDRSFYVPPVWRPVHAHEDQGPPFGVKLLAGTSGAARRASELSRRVAPEHLAVCLNHVHPGVSGMPTSRDIIAWRGFAIELPFRLERDHANPTIGPKVSEELLKFDTRMIAAGIEPIYIVDAVSGRYFIFLKADRNIRLNLATGTRADYDATARKLAGSVSGEPVPLNGYLPMPGACVVVVESGNAPASAENAIVSLSAAGGQPIPTYGSTCDDFLALAARIAATLSITH